MQGCLQTCILRPGTGRSVVCTVPDVHCARYDLPDDAHAHLIPVPLGGSVEEPVLHVANPLRCGGALPVVFGLATARECEAARLELLVVPGKR